MERWMRESVDLDHWLGFPRVNKQALLAVPKVVPMTDTNCGLHQNVNCLGSSAL